MASSSIKKACSELRILGGIVEKTIADLARVSKAKELLDMELGDAHQLDNLKEDQTNLLEVWTCIAKVWDTIDKIDMTPFQSYQQKNVKAALDAKMNEMMALPNRIR